MAEGSYFGLEVPCKSEFTFLGSNCSLFASVWDTDGEVPFKLLFCDRTFTESEVVAVTVVCVPMTEDEEDETVFELVLCEKHMQGINPKSEVKNIVFIPSIVDHLHKQNTLQHRSVVAAHRGVRTSVHPGSDIEGIGARAECNVNSR